MSCAGATGTFVLSRLDIRSSAGLKPCSSGVDLYDRSARYGSDDFFNKDLTVCTVLSARPFAWAYHGLLVICVNPYSSAKVANALDEY